MSQDRFAVVMNNKARKVKAHTIDMVARHVPAEDLFVTQTVEQSDACLDDIIARRYPLVFCGGGDGTAMRIIEQLWRHVHARRDAGEDVTMPKVGILKLGTGNGWAGQLCVPPKTGPLEHLRAGHAVKFSNFHMVREGDRLAHMGGLGIDAAVLNDYIALKNRFHGGLLWSLANSVWGYLFTIFFTSIPRFALRGSSWPMRVIHNSDEPVYRIDEQGRPAPVTITKGDTLHEGRIRWAGFGTTENFGFDLKVFPSASVMPGFMHLRLVASSIPRLVANIPKIWVGKYRHETTWDYLVKNVRIESPVDLPFQLGGDPEGYRKSVEIRVADETVDVLDFS